LTATPAERTLQARLAAHSLHAQYDSRELTAKARAASPGQLDYWMGVVDPDDTLDPGERSRRAEHARKAHFTRLALASAKARRAKKSMNVKNPGCSGRGSSETGDGTADVSAP
jgi:hypothetical protein